MKKLLILLALLLTACELLPTEPRSKYDKKTTEQLKEHNQGGGSGI